MLVTLFQILLQPEVSGGSTPVTNGGGGETPAPLPGCGGGPMDFAFIILMFAVLYLFMIRPQQKRAKEHEEMLKTLKKGDVVRTNGGIRGEVTAIDEKDVTIEIAERTRVKVLRTHLAGLEQAEKSE